jgi:hypothetical protein
MKQALGVAVLLAALTWTGSALAYCGYLVVTDHQWSLILLMGFWLAGFVAALRLLWQQLHRHEPRHFANPS